MQKPLILATRKSPLALAQTETAAAALEQNGIKCLIKTFSTAGDEITDKPLADIGGKELFVNNLRRALKEGAADIAVHSAKDMPAKPHPDFILLAAGFAEDPRDVFISPKYESLRAMPDGATVGTCSPRRAALLAEYFPKLKTVPMRGNVGTRLQKLKEGACDGTILAAAGLRRLNLIGRGADFPISEVNINFEYLNPEIFIPAPGQGVLAAECLAAGADFSRNGRAAQIRRALQDANAAPRLAAEMKFAETVGGDCRTPLGAHAAVEKESVCLRAFYAGGKQFRKTAVRIPRAEAVRAAQNAAAELSP